MGSIIEDHRRFKDIVRGRIKQNFKKYVTHGEMVGRQEKDLVKIPIPSIDIPRFRYGPKQQGGVGQGDGQPGEAMNGQPGDGQGEAGNSPGQHTLEVDVTLDELADILGEELALPRIEPRGNKSIDTTKIKYSGRGPVGPSSLRIFKESYKEALKREISSGTYNAEDPIVVPIRRDLRFRSFKTTVKPQ